MSANAVIDAVKGNDLEELERLLGAEPALAAARDEGGRSAVLLARYYNRAEVLSSLLAARPPLDIFEAAAVGDVTRLRALIAADSAAADSFAPDGFSPLGLAAFFGQTEAVRALLAAGVDLHAVARNPMRIQAIHAAVADKDEATALSIATALLDAGADPNARQHNGFTPLHAAAQNGHVRVADLLLARGADPGLRTEDGKSAADLANAGDHMELSDRLRR